MTVITTVRGIMQEENAERAKAIHNEIFGRLAPIGDSLGGVGHQTFLNPANPREFLAVDTWSDMESLQRFMAHPANPAENIGTMFEGQPEITVRVMCRRMPCALPLHCSNRLEA